jgi:hypothetical protein
MQFTVSKWCKFNYLQDLTLSDNILFNTASKGIYLGVTSATAANLLDDYEEGTWTPIYRCTGDQLSSVTYNAWTGGRYTKVGQLVTVTGAIASNAVTLGSPSGNFKNWWTSIYS